MKHVRLKVPQQTADICLLAILKDNENIVTQVLVEFGVNYYIVKSQLKDYKSPEAKSDFPESDDDDAGEPFSKGSRIRVQKREQRQNRKLLFWIILELILPNLPRKTISTQLLEGKKKLNDWLRY